MGYLEASILGLVQGLAEFLPISSSGHLALLQNFFNVDADKVLLFAILLHAGTLLAIFVVYWNDILELFAELFAMFGDLFHGRGLRINSSETRRFGFMIIIASIPTGLMGLFLNDFFESLYINIIFIGIGLIVTGSILFIAERMKDNRKRVKEMRFRDAFLIGCCQGIAIWPGISRSGSTLFGGLICGLENNFAVKYAFILSIPPILGSLILELPAALASDMNSISWGPILLGVLIAAISGFIAIKFMIKIVAKQKLIYFSIYTWLVGLGIIAYCIF